GAMWVDRGSKTVPAAALSNPDADLLHRTIEAKGTARLHLTLGARWLPDADSANVVGELVAATPATGAASSGPASSAAGPGGPPPEVGLFGAHLDSWDLATGALDDGAGVAIVLEAARLLKESGVGRRRTLRVVLFANEENGLAGAKGYAKAHAAELDRHAI